MGMQERLDKLSQLILASELEMVDSEIRRAAIEVAESLATSERPLAIKFLETSAEISGDATSLETLDYLVGKATERGHLNQTEIDSIYARAPANRWL